ncbi:MAG: hypothetical protein NDI61_14275, partial [Bdellovibrionaceae bacterium]|nr:hypothetical protein [Pseudobdellovibrionaceae bacterium]
GATMERIITLLREKNHYLEKFHEVNEQELLRFDAGNFENIEVFYGTRDKLLDMIRAIDDRLAEENELHEQSTSACTPLQKSEIEAILRRKDEWVTKILSQDLHVISWIEKEKSNIIRELQSVRKGRKAMQGYHSGESNRTLDEKA